MTTDIKAVIDGAIPFVGYQASVPEKIEALLEALRELKPWVKGVAGVQ